MEKMYFSVNGVEYFIQTRAGKNYKEIINKETGRPATNQKQVCRDCGIYVSTDPNIMNTHQAIDELIKYLNDKKENYMNKQPSFKVTSQKDFRQYSINDVKKSAKNIDLYENQIKGEPITDITLTSNGNSYTFKETVLYFEKNNYSNVFTEKNNKTLAQTIGEGRYQFLEKEVKTHYTGFLNEKLGTFLKRLKNNGDLFYKQFLNKYGDSVYSRFYMTDTNMMKEKGLYIYCIKNALKYIGRSKDPFKNRINDGYGHISPKNCYLDGQATNCHLNSLITKYKEHINLLLLPLQNNDLIDKLEKTLIKEYSPEWNIQK
jgi:hypothetical protein